MQHVPTALLTQFKPKDGFSAVTPERTKWRREINIPSPQSSVQQPETEILLMEFTDPSTILSATQYNNYPEKYH